MIIAVQIEQTAAGALLGGKLCDQFGGQIKIKILSLHAAYYTGAACFPPMQLAVLRLFSDNCAFCLFKQANCLAEMAELVDARDSKSRDGDIMGVRFPLSAPVATFKQVHIVYPL